MQNSIYGDGTNVRDWLFVEDHIDALILAMRKGKSVLIIVLVVIMKKLILRLQNIYAIF